LHNTLGHLPALQEIGSGTRIEISPDIPQIPGLLGMISASLARRRNEIRS
jgi:hypothetical protein